MEPLYLGSFLRINILFHRCGKMGGLYLAYLLDARPPMSVRGCVMTFQRSPWYCHRVHAFTRREFLKHSAAAALVLGEVGSGAIPAEPAVLVNHLGFLPAAPKFCMRTGRVALEFSLTCSDSNEQLFQGVMQPRVGDLGDYTVGEFSLFQQPGHFQIHVAGQRSESFQIAANLFEGSLHQSLRYFAMQRCGDSNTGHQAPCHLDDGCRADNHQHQDVSGGWHDACDLRKWVDATLYGMIGLCRVLDALPQMDRGGIMEELKWGNGYFGKMQEPAGYVMNYCGGDDGNRYTDNIRGTSDDRIIHVEPCELPAQFNFAAAQAFMARHTRDADRPYSRGCEDAAGRCLAWCLQNRSPGATPSLTPPPSPALRCTAWGAAGRSDSRILRPVFFTS